jgi:hypothetical protein
MEVYQTALHATTNPMTEFDYHKLLCINMHIIKKCHLKSGWFMGLIATFTNMSVISWRSVILMEETGVSEENTDLRHESA